MLSTVSVYGVGGGVDQAEKALDHLLLRLKLLMLWFVHNSVKFCTFPTNSTL
jgi:hypothetical protein